MKKSKQHLWMIGPYLKWMNFECLLCFLCYWLLLFTSIYFSSKFISIPISFILTWLNDRLACLVLGEKFLSLLPLDWSLKHSRWSSKVRHTWWRLWKVWLRCESWLARQILREKKILGLLYARRLKHIRRRIWNQNSKAFLIFHGLIVCLEKKYFLVNTFFLYATNGIFEKNKK